MGLADSSLLSPADGVLHRRVGDEVVLVGMNQGEMYSLDPIGAVVWERIAAGTTFGDLVAAVVADYEVAGDVARRDLADLIDDLRSRELIRVAVAPEA